MIQPRAVRTVLDQVVSPPYRDPSLFSILNGAYRYVNKKISIPVNGKFTFFYKLLDPGAAGAPEAFAAVVPSNLAGSITNQSWLKSCPEVAPCS